MEIRRPQAFFRLNRHDGVSPERVYDILREVQDRMGERNAGAIGFGVADKQGFYWVLFERTDTADLFEQRYRNAGGTPRRQQRGPASLVLVSPETVAVATWAAIMANVNAFISHITGDPRRRTAQWN